MRTHIVEKADVVGYRSPQFIRLIIIVVGKLFPFHTGKERFRNRIVKRSSGIGERLFDLELTKVFPKIKRRILQPLVGMEDQPGWTPALFKGIIEHPLNKCRVRDIGNVERHYKPGVKINDDPDGIKNIFYINVGNVAHPNHVRSFRHEFLLNAVAEDLIFAVGGGKIAKPELFAYQSHFLHQTGNMFSAYSQPLALENKFYFLSAEPLSAVDENLVYERTQFIVGQFALFFDGTAQSMMIIGRFQNAKGLAEYMNREIGFQTVDSRQFFR